MRCICWLCILFRALRRQSCSMAEEESLLQALIGAGVGALMAAQIAVLPSARELSATPFCASLARHLHVRPPF